MRLDFDYRSVVRSSEKAEWVLDDVFPEDTKLDFTRFFLPPSLVPATELTFLSESEQRVRNHIASNAYMNLFGFVEEYIIAMALQHANAEVFGNHDAIRALSRFADEESKHQALFNRYCAVFARDFGQRCDVLGAAAEVATVILSKSPLGVMLMTLHLELITQEHYVNSVKDDALVDRFFASLLKNHWLEESQHARIDQLEIQKMVARTTPADIAQAIYDYVDLLGALDGLLRAQAQMDGKSFERAVQKKLTPAEMEAFVGVHHRNYRGLFLRAGVLHETLLDTIEAIDPGSRAKVAAQAQAYA